MHMTQNHNRNINIFSRVYVAIKNRILYFSLMYFSKLVKNQKENPSTIPILIINYNQLFYLKQLVNFLLARNFSNVIIIDNNSSYPPLLNYYSEIGNKITIERMDKNYGHMVFFENKTLQHKYGKGYFVITDADILPNFELPIDFMSRMINILDNNYLRITKAALALRIDNIPDSYSLKEKVLSWEKKFWEIEVEPNVYSAQTDTTFALYKPFYPRWFNNLHFLSAFRIAGNYTAKHGGWYIDFTNPTEEYLFYKATSTNSNSWKMDETGNLVGFLAKHI